MILSEEDKNESLRVGQLIKKFELIDEEYVNKESDLIFRKQPFLISLLLGYRLDLKELELEEIMRIIFLIWEYFKNQPFLISLLLGYRHDLKELELEEIMKIIFLIW